MMDDGGDEGGLVVGVSMASKLVGALLSVALPYRRRKERRRGMGIYPRELEKILRAHSER
jgi:hypothetical protein